MTTLPAEIEIFELNLPRRADAYGCGSLDDTSGVLIRLWTENGNCGWGRAIARRHLTGETLESIEDDIRSIIWPSVASFACVDDLRNGLLKIPAHNDERIFTAARCAVMTALINTLGFDWFSPIAAIHEKFTHYLRDNLALTPTCCELIVADNPANALKRLKKLIKSGYRHFRLALTGEHDSDLLTAKTISQTLADSFDRSASRRNKTSHYSLIADVQDKWKYNEVVDKAHQFAEMGFNAICDPCPVRIGVLSHLAWDCPLPIIANSSCVTEAQLDVALGAEGKIWPMLSVEKCGGPDLLANMALSCANGRTPWVFGGDLLQDSLLSIIQRQTLMNCPPPVLIESCGGAERLTDDILLPRCKPGRGGVLNLANNSAIGLRLRAEKLSKYARSIFTLDKAALQTR